MTTPTALPRAEATTAYTRANALARLCPAATLGLVNVLTIDPVTPLVTLAIVLEWLPATGISLRRLARVSWPLLVAAGTLVVVNTIADPSPGLGASDVSTGLVTGARLLAIALPGVLAFATIDSVDLTDSLVQQLRVPPRFGYGALAALRLMPALAQDWDTYTLAARARGVAPSGPVSRVRLLGRRLLGLLVTAIRRATRLSVALDARGFDDARRSTSRASPWTGADTALSLGGVLVAAVVVAVSVAVGSWDPLVTG